MVKYKIEVDRSKCKRCGYCYSMDSIHFEPTPPIGLFEKAYAKLMRSWFLNKSRVVGGSLNKSKSAGTFNDEKIELARKVEAICPASAITITEL
jgi:ferredoxin